jgi:hypothetical protein
LPVTFECSARPTAAAPLSRTRGNAAKPSPGIDIVGSASVRMFNGSRIAAMLSPNARGSNRITSACLRAIANRGNHSNPTKVIVERIHTFPFTPGVSQTKILQQARLRKQE